ncbi:MAG TPA: hypothetical protein VG125_33870 [Pirellulales bacterium]|jgi:hypothetical protein|nr:hypothetical protein [Pirellulales bacterium]
MGDDKRRIAYVYTRLGKVPDGLPEDARIIESVVDPRVRRTRLTVWSSQFDPVKDNAEIPFWERPSIVPEVFDWV